MHQIDYKSILLHNVDCLISTLQHYRTTIEQLDDNKAKTDNHTIRTTIADSCKNHIGNFFK